VIRGEFQIHSANEIEQLNAKWAMHLQYIESKQKEIPQYRTNLILGFPEKEVMGAQFPLQKFALTSQSDQRMGLKHY
jgi:hypothetical protein